MKRALYISDEEMDTDYEAIIWDKRRIIISLLLLLHIVYY